MKPKFIELFPSYFVWDQKLSICAKKSQYNVCSHWTVSKSIVCMRDPNWVLKPLGVN
jgi:hypothetical protein